jgi:large subunit ribosomal protein L19
MEKVYAYNRQVRSSRQMPELRSGDIVKVHRKIKEGAKERVQIFEGIVIAIKGKQSSSPMITLRRVSFGIGVEITVPLYSPGIVKIEAVKRAKTRQSKLYYLKQKGLRISKLKTKELASFVTEEEKEVPAAAEKSEGETEPNAEKKSVEDKNVEANPEKKE